VINLFNNLVQVISDSIATFQELEYISLNANELVQVSPQLFSLPNLVQLHLRHNQIRHLGNYEKTITALKKLDISFNKIDTLPASIYNENKLNYLDAYNNELEFISSDIKKLSALRFLFLGRNHLKYIPEELAYCSLLQELDVVYCGVINLPSSLSNLRKLELVYIDNRTIPFYSNLRMRYRQTIQVIPNGKYPYRFSQ